MPKSEFCKSPIDIFYEKACTISSDEHIGIVCKMSADLMKTLINEDLDEKLQNAVRSLEKERNLIEVSNNYRDPLHSLCDSLAKSIEMCIGVFVIKERKRNLIQNVQDVRASELNQSDRDDYNEVSGSATGGEVQSKTIDPITKKKPNRERGYCSLCDKWFGTLRDLRVHNRRHSDNEEERMPYPCDKCDKRFATPSNLKVHINVHHLDDNHPKKLKYHCKICGKVNNTSSSLKDHMLKHKGRDEERLPHKCNYCETRFSQKPNMERHQLSHLPEDHPKKQKYECDICGKKFTSPYSLKGHIRSHHDQNSMPLKCTDCDKRFNFPCQLENHRRTHLKYEERKKPFECDQCDKRYSQMSDLYKHKRTHLPDYAPARFPCNVCGKVYSKCGIYVHMKTHLGELPKKFTCEICGNSYQKKETLENHKRKHLEIEEDRFPFKCDVCDLKFSSSVYRNRHKKIHLGIEYKCEICDKVFNLQAAFNTHKKIHNAKNECKIEADKERLFQCDICSIRFTQKGNLAKHMRRQHEKKKSSNMESSLRKLALTKRSSRPVDEETEGESDDEDEDEVAD